MKASAKLFGDVAMIRFLKSIPEAVAKEIHSAVEGDMSSVASASQARAPRKTGQLAASLLPVKTEWFDGGKAFTITVAYSADHAPYREALGKRRRFLRNAFKKQKKAIREATWQAVLKYWQQHAPKPKL